MSKLWKPESLHKDNLTNSMDKNNHTTNDHIKKSGVETTLEFPLYLIEL